MSKHYRTIKDARGAMALDYGFDPFTVGQVLVGPDGQQYRRATKAALAALGYPIDAELAANEVSEQAKAWTAHEERAQRTRPYDDRMAAEKQAAVERRMVSSTCEQAFAAVGLTPRNCAMDQYGDDTSANTVILTLADRRIIMERKGQEVVSAKIASLVASRLVVRRSGKYMGDRKARHSPDYADPCIGYVLELRLGDRRTWRAVPMRGGPALDTEHDSRDDAVAMLISRDARPE